MRRRFMAQLKHRLAGFHVGWHRNVIVKVEPLTVHRPKKRREPKPSRVLIRQDRDIRGVISKICVIRGFDWKFNAIRRGRLAHRQ
jgi:hypothetical protein